ncbi:hypothetical protein ACO0K0_02545 [Undibacterium sp. SXout11W]|uniref:hypothetical protein n=1 Tax=Undibacterium sp. SXout11W TaxID=3413050 RepID=UPI003BF3E1D0
MNTFHERLIAANNKQYQERKEEIELMSDLLTAAQPVIALLEDMVDDKLRTDQSLINIARPYNPIHLCINRFHLDTALHAALHSLGFIEASRKNYALQYDRVVLVKGDIAFSIDTAPGYLKHFSREEVPA